MSEKISEKVTDDDECQAIAKIHDTFWSCELKLTGQNAISFISPCQSKLKYRFKIVSTNTDAVLLLNNTIFEDNKGAIRNHESQDRQHNYKNSDN